MELLETLSLVYITSDTIDKINIHRYLIVQKLCVLYKSSKLH